MFLMVVVMVSTLVAVRVVDVGDLDLLLGVVGDLDWKTLIGWRALVDYIEPGDATERKEALQVYAVIVAGLIASITAGVGLANLRLTRKNIEQQRVLEAQRAEGQRELEAQRGQGFALQAYYEQIGKLLTEHDLRNTQRNEVRELARGQTFALMRDLEASRKGNLVEFLKGAGLLETENPAVVLVGTDLHSTNLQRAFLEFVNLEGAILAEANLAEANLQGANLREAYLQRADLLGATLESADLQGANLAEANLESAHLRVAKLQNAALESAHLLLARLDSARLDRANLRNATLQSADLSNATLESADLQGANLRYAKLRNANLDRANLRDATMPDGSKHP